MMIIIMMMMMMVHCLSWLWFRAKPRHLPCLYIYMCVYFPERAWAKGSSNSWGLSNIFTSSHPIFKSHIFSSSHPHIFSSSHLHILSRPRALSSFSIFLLRRGAVPTRRHETQPFRTKRGSIAKNWGEIAILSVPRQPFRTKWGSIAKKLRWNCNFITSAAAVSHEMRFDR